MTGPYLAMLSSLGRGSRRAGLCLLALALLALAPAAWGADSPSPAATAQSRMRAFRVGAPPKGAEVTGLGTARCLKSLKLGFAERGTLAEVLVEEGATVKKGQVLARLDDRVLKSDLAAKEAELARARKDAGYLAGKRTEAEKLHQGRAITLSDLKEAAHKQEQAEAQAGQLEAQVAGLKAQLKNTVLVAPLAGTVVERLAEPGEVVGQGSGEVVSLMACQQMLAEVAFGEKLYGRLIPGQMVLLTADAVARREFLGKVHSKSPQVDDKDRTFKVKVLVDNQDGALRPGMFVRALLLMGGPGEPVLVPEPAILAEADGYGVVDLAREGRVEKRKVRLGRRERGMVEVLEGLAPGDLVIMELPENAAGALPPVEAK